MNILIVDDHELQRKVLAARLKKHGHSSTEAADGVEAIDILRQETTDAIISDVLMPRMDGYELCQHVRTSTKPDLPIILYSAIYTSSDEEQIALSSGADAFLRKPVTEEEILGVLERLLAEKKRHDAVQTKPQKSSAVLKEYSARLVEKLEENAAQLQAQKTEVEQSEERFRTLVTTAAAAIFIYTKTEILFVNSATASITGYDDAELYRMKPVDLIFPDDRQLAERRLFMGNPIVESSSRIEIRIRHKTGQTKWLDFSANTINFVGLEAIIGTAFDITSRKNAELALKEQAALLDVDPSGISAIDPDGTVLFWNKGAEKLYGWKKEEIIGRKILDKLSPELHAVYSTARDSVFKSGQWQGEWTHSTENGNSLIIESDWTLVKDSKEQPKFIYVVDSDITEKKALQEQLLRSQRMESLGLIAGGIAHELNNVLGPILLSFQMLNKQITDDRSRKLLQLIETSANRGSEIVKQILSFARGADSAEVTFNPAHVISELKQLIKQTFPKNIDIQTRIPGDLWSISGGTTSLHQVLFNLCLNARDAMPDGGTLTIHAANEILDQHYSRFRPNIKAGPYVLLTVTDTGLGISPDKLNRIFEPFFTTKSSGKGTGLGLSVVAGIVQNHGGFLNVYSEEGHGSSFKVYLPAVHTKEVEQVVNQTTALPVGNGETILIIEDEPTILEITTEILESSGYVVLSAADGAAGVAAYAGNKSTIALVLCDIAMPFMDGPATIRALQKINKNVKVVVVSGFSEGKKSIESLGNTVRAFIPKPYPAETLVKTIREALS